MGRDGRLGIGWPTEYGGQGRSLAEQFIFYDESWRTLAPIPALTINAIAQTIMAFGSEEQKPLRKARETPFSAKADRTPISDLHHHPFALL
jgi:alkylation response protein AidB-like acyl-CoA dehydrogenase